MREKRAKRRDERARVKYEPGWVRVRSLVYFEIRDRSERVRRCTAACCNIIMMTSWLLYLNLRGLCYVNSREFRETRNGYPVSVLLYRLENFFFPFFIVKLCKKITVKLFTVFYIYGKPFALSSSKKNDNYYLSVQL